ncbi:DUF2115 family protein [Methanobrevibacter sp.]|uniref:DUF2115 family protein n=1 Tax=Methanobrevibacter sp. TaxID=66852 RepID=UPI003869F5E5
MDNESLELCDELLKIAHKEKITGNSVLEILKKYCSTITVFDMMTVSAEIIEENKYVQANYREDSQKSYVETFILRVREILADNNDYTKRIDKKEFVDAIKTLMSNRENQTEKSKSKFPLIGCIASIYTTFLLEEPIHKVGTLFPGSLKVEEKDGKFYCPVRDANIDTPNAVCNICLAEQLDF